jgi:hypothetical protein
MRLLRIGNYLINPLCIVQAWTNFDASEVKIRLLCNDTIIGDLSPCVVESEGKLEKMDNTDLTLIGEEAQALKAYLDNFEDLY